MSKSDWFAKFCCREHPLPCRTQSLRVHILLCALCRKCELAHSLTTDRQGFLLCNISLRFAEKDMILKEHLGVGQSYLRLKLLSWASSIDLNFRCDHAQYDTIHDWRPERATFMSVSELELFCLLSWLAETGPEMAPNSLFLLGSGWLRSFCPECFCQRRNCLHLLFQRNSVSLQTKSCLNDLKRSVGWNEKRFAITHFDFYFFFVKPGLRNLWTVTLFAPSTGMIILPEEEISYSRCSIHWSKKVRQQVSMFELNSNFPSRCW